MNVSQILKSVKSEVSNFLEAKKAEKKNPKRNSSTNNLDRFVKSNANDLMDVKVKARYVNGVCYINGG
jgi:hypothetical protein